MKKIVCPKCNNILSNKDTMCMNCGLDISAINLEIKNNEITKKKTKKPIIIVTELFILIVITTIYTILFVPKIIEISKEKPIEFNKNEKTFDDIANEIEQ